MLAEVWYVLLAGMLAVYVMLDGFDLGAGILHLGVAKTDEERNEVLRTLGPVWDGNEVWLLAAGGTMVMAFPVLYARAFSGFYLPLMLVLWLLVFRALGIELRHQVRHPLWEQFWDVAFSLASLLLVVFFGTALGNVVRGVTTNDAGEFFGPLWTNLRVDPQPGIIDWYTLLVGITATAALAMHGAVWLAWRTQGRVQQRSRAVVLRAWVATLLLIGAVTVTTFLVQPQMARNLRTTPAWWLAPALALGGLITLHVLVRRERWKGAFFSSCAFLAGMLGSAAAAIFPYVLPGRGEREGLTIAAAAADPYALRVALYWWIPGVALAVGYFVFNYSRSFGRAALPETSIEE
ncbi:MAG: cytochrome d ubiquinol oxidase subunit II [Myxococcales bacterium]|jgi:cytochrome d ubiquinol oxidase subunit II